jgi:hypothetical protein
MYHKRLPSAPRLVLLALLAGAGCEARPTAPALVASNDGSSSLGRENDAVALPFEARFFTDLAGLLPDESCGAPPVFLNIQQGYGAATHLGRFSVHIRFCIDATDLLDDGELTEGESLPYWNGVGAMVAANGDELFFTIAGAVVPSDHPDFDFEFSDPFHFSGGTGRFSGATGGGVTNSLVDRQRSRTHHEWSGTLTLPRG